MMIKNVSYELVIETAYHVPGKTDSQESALSQRERTPCTLLSRTIHEVYP